MVRQYLNENTNFFRVILTSFWSSRSMALRSPNMKKQFLKFLDLTSALDDFDHIHANIENGVSFRGTNLWILIFAIILASVGLNTNSTAVIIGAMLISPLMGPINGMGYSIATYDFALFRRSLKNFAFAVSASLATSTIYFLISPISTAHSELLARTTPTIYDVLIALFGGLAGIVAMSSKHKGNVIPGVAIATALMPPLCTAGYGLATGQLSYFFGAFYLFAINTVFIGISSVLFSQMLSFPIRTLVEPSEKTRVNRWISVVIAITIIPSIYFGYLLVEKERFNKKANQFISSVGAVDGSYLLRSDINAGTKAIRLIYGGNTVSEPSKKIIFERAAECDLDGTDISFEQGFSFSAVSDDITEVGNNLKAEINRLKAELQQKEMKRDSAENTSSIGGRLVLEIQTLYPDIIALYYSNAMEFSARKDTTDTTNATRIPTIVLTSSNNVKESDRRKIEQWLGQRLQLQDQLRVLFTTD